MSKLSNYLAFKIISITIIACKVGLNKENNVLYVDILFKFMISKNDDLY